MLKQQFKRQNGIKSIIWIYTYDLTKQMQALPFQSFGRNIKGIIAWQEEQNVAPLPPLFNGF